MSTTHVSYQKFLMGLTTLAALTLVAVVPASWAIALSEAFVRIEINASDGDVGFHAKFDGEPAKVMRLRRPGQGDKVILSVRARRNLERQGLTENFFESAEPSCAEQSLAAFLLRFPTGVYRFEGQTNEGEELTGSAFLSHALPAAPDLSGFNESIVELDEDHPVVIQWAHGTDLGACHDQDLVVNGIIPDPAGVAVESWEVAVEPDAEKADLAAAGLPFNVFTVQLPAGQMRVTVPSEYLRPYVEAGFTEFKFEVGAKSGQNQTFAEGTFTVELGD
jgi:hypothetical protein